MKIAICSDIHSNLPALEKFLEETKDCDKRWCLGDIVGYGPWPLKCLKKVREEFDMIIQGNHDRVVALDGEGIEKFSRMAREGARHSINVTSEEDKEWLENLEETKRLEVKDKTFRVAHSHPTHTDRYVYPQDFEEVRKDFEEDFILLGHTHIPKIKILEKGRIINPGGLGQPRDKNPKSPYCIIEIDDNKTEIKRFSYEKREYINQVRILGLPKRTGQRILSGR